MPDDRYYVAGEQVEEIAFRRLHAEDFEIAGETFESRLTAADGAIEHHYINPESVVRVSKPSTRRTATGARRRR